MKNFTSKLKQHNLKVTPQRLAIYNVLSSTNKHPSAETIYKCLEETHPSMSLATVYKTLDTFKKEGLIQELNMGEDCFRYDCNNTPHAHVICVECHKVFDLPMLEYIETLKAELKNKTDFQIIKEQIFIYGVCPCCNKAKQIEAMAF